MARPEDARATNSFSTNSTEGPGSSAATRVPPRIWMVAALLGATALAATGGLLAQRMLATPAPAPSLLNAAPTPIAPERRAAFLRHYADMAAAMYEDAAASARALTTADAAFVATPNEANLDAARAAWRAARVPYQQTEVFRFYGGPIDALEPLVNTWPVDEGFIESEDGEGGIIGDRTAHPIIDANLLARLNMKDGETSVSTGYHAVEFLLWGRDTSLEHAGTRPASDFALKTALGARRGAYLRSAGELLVEHLESLAKAWKDEPGSYRTRFLSMDSSRALALVIKGMGSLGRVEMAGERLTVAYRTKDQENEHSCFSDNTRDDLAWDAVGIESVCRGHYRHPDGTGIAGPGLCDLLRDVDPSLAQRLETDMRDTVAALRRIPQPFDAAIAGKDDEPGRRAVAEAIAALGRQSSALTLAAAKLGVGDELTRTIAAVP